ncbi:SMP-30/gluconolactonase/LRE family protein [Cnuella takakiae]|nr:SMP-30/gluconolactonase/LRE family protein [Cnuella takakiae]OLY94937.1 gluconolactonase [Cnuella takakiae]
MLVVACKGSASNETVPQQDSLYQSKAFTPAKSFTAGAEGPAVDKEGNVYAVNFRTEGTIGRMAPNGDTSLYLQLPKGSTGNGIRLYKNNLYIADYTGHNILQLDPAAKILSVFAHEAHMNQPNDIAVDSKGRFYASDPNWKESTGQLWRIDADGKTVLLAKDLGTTNGVEVSPDEKRLYVNESVQRKVWIFDLSPEGAISNKRLLLSFPDHGMDGMRCDAAGNLYITRHGKGTVAKISPDGKLLQEITLNGKLPSNIAFGGPDGRTAYVTLQDNGNMESFRVDEPGREWKLQANW